MEHDQVFAARERRGAIRHSLERGMLPVVVESGLLAWAVAVDNISPRGLGMRLERPLDPGTLLPVQLLNRSGNFWHLKVMRVVHATPADEGWLVGNVFLAQFSDDEFRVLVNLPPLGESIPSL
jgi:hypothetical protein